MRRIIGVLLLTALSLCGMAEEDNLIRWWPRIKPAVIPTRLTQLAILEFLPELKIDGEATVEIVLPEGIKYVGCPTAWINPDRPRVHSIPSPELTAYASEFVQENNILKMKFPAGSFNKEPQTWLPLLLEVNAPEGYSAVKVTIESGHLKYSEDIELKVSPELSGVQCRKPLILWDYQGTDAEYLPIFINGFVRAGFNRFYEGREELPNRLSAVDLQDKFNTKHGVAFSPESVQRYYETHPLPPELTDRADVVTDCAWLVDHPNEAQYLLRNVFQFMTNGKKFDYVILDCERGAFKNNDRIVNDLSAYSIERFARKYAITEKLTQEIITQKYQEQWIEYCCALTADYSALMEQAARRIIPGCNYEIYSGYEYSDGTTKRFYAMNWAKMSKSKMDAAGVGYFGSRKEIESTAAAIAPVPLIPAEMYMENFMTASVPMPRLQVETFAMRLIQSYLWSGCHGMQIWHGGVLTGAGLASVDIFNSFVNATSEFTDGAMRLAPEELLRTTPRTAIDNIYCFKKDGKLMLIILNPRKNESTLRFNFKSGDGVSTNETVELSPYGYVVKIY